ncbi:MAG: glycosyltransferase family 2 protein [Candidatus Stahlbacteria bacterium]|nr:glycosyltransferase family 2 protein [Candidatus Stahlbacteria bacterium]
MSPKEVEPSRPAVVGFTLCSNLQRDFQQVSVITATYNNERYIKSCIESILCQSIKDFEFIIVDDGSTDKTFEILREYEKKDKRVVIIRNKENKGAANSRNAAFHKSKGKFIAIIDSDDVALPTRLEKQVRFLNSHTEYGIVGSMIAYIDENGKHITLKEALPKGGEIIGDMLEDPCQIFNSSCMFRREVFEELGGYREEFKKAEDWDLFLRLQERGLTSRGSTSKGYKLYNLPEILHYQRTSFTRGMVLYRREQFIYGEIAKRLAYQRRNKGKDLLEEGNYEAFNKLKEEISGRWMPRWVELSANYFKWSHHMYHRGPKKLAQDFIKKSVATNPFNLSAWVFLFFLYSNKRVQTIMLKLKRTLIKKPVVKN